MKLYSTSGTGLIPSCSEIHSRATSREDRVAHGRVGAASLMKLHDAEPGPWQILQVTVRIYQYSYMGCLEWGETVSFDTRQCEV